MICPHSPALNPSHQMTSGTQKTSRGNEKIHQPSSEAPDVALLLPLQERTVVPGGLHIFLLFWEKSDKEEELMELLYVRFICSGFMLELL